MSNRKRPHGLHSPYERLKNAPFHILIFLGSTEQDLAPWYWFWSGC